MNIHKKWLAGAALAAVAGTAPAQDPLGNIVVALDAFAINLNTAAQSLLSDASVRDGVFDGAFAVQTLLSDLAAGTPLEAVATDNLNFVGVGTGGLSGVLFVVDDLAEPVLNAGGEASPFELLASGAEFVLGGGFPVIGGGALSFGGSGEDGLGIVNVITGGLSDDPLGGLLFAIGPEGGLSGFGFTNGIPLIGGFVQNPGNIPVLGAIIGGGLLSGDSFPGMGFPSLGIPTIGLLSGGLGSGLGGGLLGGTDGIPVISGLLEGEGGIPVIGSLPLAGGGSIPVIGMLLPGGGGDGGIPVLGDLLAGGTGGIPVLGGLLEGGIPVIGSLPTAGGGSIPFIGTLLPSDGGIPVVSGLLGGAGGLPLDALDPGVLLDLLGAVPLQGLPL